MNLTANHLEDYISSRRLDGVRDNSIAREITDIKAILNWATRRKPPLIPINPVRDFKGPAGNDQIVIPPEPEEIEAIHKKACPHLKRFIMLSCYTGARPGDVELLSLTWQSVSWSSRSIRIINAAKGILGRANDRVRYQSRTPSMIC
jgi:integrase